MKIIKSLFVLLFFISLSSPVSAGTDGVIFFESNLEAENFINDNKETILLEGDTIITKDAIEVGLSFANLNEINNNSNIKNTRSISLLSSGYETWTITKAETLRPYGIVYGDYNYNKLTAGQSSTFGFSLSLNFISGIGLNATANWSKSESFAGPGSSELVAPGIYATHRVFSAIMKSSVVKYTYRITDMYTGVYLRTETRIYSANNTTETYSNIVNINPSTGLFKIRSANSSSYKSYTNEGAWSKNVNSSSPSTHIYF